MENEFKLITGALVTLAVSATALVILPYLQLRSIQPPPQLKDYSAEEALGRQQYISEGCVYCHSQQPRDASQAPDAKRGWGRAPVPGDYYYDKPHLLGTMRTGPDLFNIGARQPSIDWQLGHLYQPRAYTPGSIMPGFPYLFEWKAQAASGDKVVTLPPKFAPEKGVIVAKPEAIRLAKYLLSLNHTYPVLGATPAN